MDAAQWTTSLDPKAMLDYLVRRNPVSGTTAGEKMGNRTSDRKLRLFAVAFYRLTAERELDPADVQLFADAEAIADGVAPLPARESSWVVLNADAAEAARLALAEVKWFATARRPEAMTVAANLLREIIGNPFRPVYWPDDPKKHAEPNTVPRTARIDPSKVPHVEMRRAWLTPTVVAIAEQIDESRAFEELPVLADALVDAGMPEDAEAPCPRCLPNRDDRENPFGVGPGYVPERDPASGRHEGGWTNCKTCNGGWRGGMKAGVVLAPHPLLEHLRSGGPHARGCWCLDLLLGKA